VGKWDLSRAGSEEGGPAYQTGEDCSSLPQREEGCFSYEGKKKEKFLRCNAPGDSLMVRQGQAYNLFRVQFPSGRKDPGKEQRPFGGGKASNGKKSSHLLREKDDLAPRIKMKFEARRRGQ